MSGIFNLEETLHQAQLAEATPDTTRLAIRLLDLTSLNDDDSIESIEWLCNEAFTPAGPVAAVCVYPRFVDTALKNLKNKATHVATVISFPDGKDDPHTITNATLDAINAGASEIDIVINYQAMMHGDEHTVRKALRACRQACTGHITMKVILESGAFSLHETLERACVVAMEEGADFLKTSTGKISSGASLEDAAIILRAIRHFEIQINYHHKIGFKASGGIRTAQQAAHYIELAKLIMGEDWLTPETFRFGASSLKDDLLKNLGLLDENTLTDATKPTQSPSSFY